MGIPYVFGLLLVILVQATAVAAKDDPYESKAVDVRLVIDISGSMKRTDPNNLRIPAVELMCRLMPEGGRAGIWTFGQSVNMLNKLQTVDASWKTLAIANSQKINSSGLLTNIGAALEKAAADVGDGKHRKHIILLTDGMVDLGPDPAANQVEWQRIVNQVLPKLKQNGFTLHTIALSNEADQDLLSKLSLATDGAAAVAYSADELVKTFLRVFDTASPSQQLPLSGNSFQVDDSIDELTALIFRGDPSAQLQLEGPDKNSFTAATAPQNVNWYRGENYDLVTFKKPSKGLWTIKGDVAAGSRVTVVSDLNLQVKPMPNNVFVGHLGELSLVLQEDGKAFINPEFLKLMKVSGSIDLNPGDAEPQHIWAQDLSSDKPPVDGIFHRDLPVMDKPGVYTLEVTADGKTFKRQYRQRIAVRERFQMDVDALGDNSYELTIKTFDDTIDKSSVQLMVNLEDAQHQKTPLELHLTPIESWLAEVVPPAPGEYQIKAAIKGKTISGETFHYDLVSNTLLHKITAQEKPITAPVTPEPSKPEPVAPEPEPEPETAKNKTPGWLLYLTLGGANLLLMGGGFLLYKKLIVGKPSDAILDEFADSKLAPPPPPPPPKAKPKPPPPPLEDYDETQMQVPPVEEEEPPMEDLDEDMDIPDDSALMGFDLAEPDGEAPEPQTFMPPEPDLSDDDIDALLAQQNKPAEEEDDMVKAMLKAQGLDLAEHEMDDAISNLIDELDTAGARQDPEKPTPMPNDFDDFDDFGLDDK